MYSLILNGQIVWTEHTSCSTAYELCGVDESGFQILGTSLNEEACNSTFYMKFRSPDIGSLIFLMNSYTATFTLYGPMAINETSYCNQIASNQVNQVNQTIEVLYNEGLYILKIQIDSCINSEINLEFKLHKFLYPCSFIDYCKDCIGTFSPTPGKYLLSAWTKGEESNKNSSYETPYIDVSFAGSTEDYSFQPSGKIIDDWQRIDGEVTVPEDATSIKIGLNCKAGTCFFDDIRFVPIDGSMISYVYDPVNLRLKAQLDERNYATFYEYDEEGKLIRVKKETERGIMTIQENRDNISK